MPKVSVIVPNFNHARYLSKRMGSIFNQTFEDFEVVLLDDCSTDNSVDLLRSYSTNPKVSHLVINNKNSGSTFKQWVKGIELSKGEYIWIAESDDFCDYVFLEKLVPQFRDGVGIVFCESNYVDSEGEIILQRPTSDAIEEYMGVDFIKSQLIFGNAINNASMAVFERNLLYHIDQSSFIKMKYCGDWLFWSLLAEKTKIKKVLYPYNYFRRHINSVSTRSEKNGLLVYEGIQVLSYNKKHLNKKEILSANYFWFEKLSNKGFSLKLLPKLLLLLINKHRGILSLWFKGKINLVLEKFNVFLVIRRIRKVLRK